MGSIILPGTARVPEFLEVDGMSIYTRSSLRMNGDKEVKFHFSQTLSDEILSYLVPWVVELLKVKSERRTTDVEIEERFKRLEDHIISQDTRITSLEADNVILMKREH